MATRALSADAGRASSEIPENISAPTRRKLIYVAAVGAVAIAVPAAANPSRARPWDAALARFKSALVAAERHRVSDYDPAWQRIDAAAGEMPSMDVVIDGLNPRVVHVDMRAIYPVGPEYNPLRKAQDTWRGWWGRRCACEDSHRSILARQDRLWEVEYAAREALMAEPAPDAAALAYKMRLALDNEKVWESDRAALVVDVERLVA